MDAKIDPDQFGNFSMTIAAGANGPTIGGVLHLTGLSVAEAAEEPPTLVADSLAALVLG